MCLLQVSLIYIGFNSCMTFGVSSTIIVVLFFLTRILIEHQLAFYVPNYFVFYLFLVPRATNVYKFIRNSTVIVTTRQCRVRNMTLKIISNAHRQLVIVGV